MLWKRLAQTWQSHRLYVLLAISIVVFVAVYLLVPDPPGYAPSPTATPLPAPLPGVVRLTNDWARDLSPAWSPDGEHIAFCSLRHGHRALYVMRADGSNVTQLTGLPSVAHDVSWSPDGEHILFVAGGIYTIDADGSQLTELTAGTEPVWSPDGLTIAFISDRDDTPDLYTVTIGDGRVTRLTDNHAWTQHPAWSPDGDTIAFHSTREGNVAIYTLDVACVAQRKQDGPCLSRLTDTATENREPAWSPDGTRIVFTSLRDGNPEIYVMDAGGSRQTRLTDLPNVDRLPAWSPDGAHIVFLSSPDLQRVHNDVYVVRPDGSDLRRLTNDGLVNSIAWSPDGRCVAFVSHRDSDNLKYCSPCNTEIYAAPVGR